MKTFLPQNQFLPNSAPARTSPGAGDAAAMRPPPVPAAADFPNSAMPTAESGGAFSDPSGSAAPPALIPAREGGPQEAPAPRCTEQHDGAGAICLTEADEALYWQLRRADNPFERDLPELPDVHAFLDAIEPEMFLNRRNA